MNRISNGDWSHHWTRVGVKIVHGATLALILAIAIPARAGDRAVKSRVNPVYPEMAKRMKISGAVKLEAIVDALGKVTDVKTVSGNRLLAVAAEDAVRKWKFEPGASNSNVSVEVNFAHGQ